MGFINSNGQVISYECTDLIEELKEDIAEFGKDTKIVVWCKDYMGVIIYTNYDFISRKEPIGQYEFDKDEFSKEMTMRELLELLEKQNSVI